MTNDQVPMTNVDLARHALWLWSLLLGHWSFSVLPMATDFYERQYQARKTTKWLVVLFVLGLGYWAGISKRFDADQVKGVNELVLDFALPAIMFVGTSHGLSPVAPMAHVGSVSRFSLEYIATAMPHCR
jgi:hypothetical protein